MSIIYHNRTRLSRNEEKRLGVKYVSLENLFRTSDIVSIHSPHTPQTHEIINLKVFNKMKRTAFLINTARGKIINEKDLAIALKRLIDANYPLTGASDHGVSEAIYLDDPDKNGVELYWDKPKDQWPVDDKGNLQMVSEPLDLEDLLRSAV